MIRLKEIHLNLTSINLEIKLIENSTSMSMIVLLQWKKRSSKMRLIDLEKLYQQGQTVLIIVNLLFYNSISFFLPSLLINIIHWYAKKCHLLQKNCHLFKKK